jgi:dipeptidyl aminopeptidase/acylaminoacyl peptidase
MVFVVISLVYYTHKKDFHKYDSRIFGELLSQYPMVVRLSPDAQKILLKTRYASDFEITVYDKAKERKINSIRSEDTQLSLTWSPSSDRILYQSSPSGNRNYGLYLWDIDSSKPHFLNVPISHTAAPPIRWSPDGTKFLYFVGDGNRGELTVIYLKGSLVQNIYAIGHVFPNSDFVWSPDGKAVAYVSAMEHGNVKIITSVSGTHSVRTYEIMNRGEIKDISWSPDGRSLILSVRGQFDEHNQIRILEFNPLKNELIAHLDSTDIFNPRWLHDSERFIFFTNFNGVNQIDLGSTSSPQIQSITNDESVKEFLDLWPTGDGCFYLKRGFVELPKIVSLQISSNPSEKAIYPDQPIKPFGQTSPEFVTLEASDGIEIPCYLWKSDRMLNTKPSAIINIHGGPHLQETPAWDAGIQSLVASGIDILTLNYRGSKNSGATFESCSAIQIQVKDVLAAREYLKNCLRIPDDRIYLLGSSYGTRLASYAFVAAPNAFGGLVLLSTVSSPDLPDFSLKKARIKIAFHGRHDNASDPAVTLRELKRLFGEDFRWYVFDDEGHFFQRTKNWAIIYTNIIEALKDNHL